MGEYLSSAAQRQGNLRCQRRNAITTPDENYAREIMQLFTIGLVQPPARWLAPARCADGLPIPTYNQTTTITELAKVFTGFSYFTTTANATSNPNNFRSARARTTSTR